MTTYRKFNTVKLNDEERKDKYNDKEVSDTGNNNLLPLNQIILKFTYS